MVERMEKCVEVNDSADAALNVTPKLSLKNIPS